MGERMAYTITLMPSGHTFQAEAGESILRAGLAAGYSIPFSCKQGVCRSCRGKLVSGEVDIGDVHPAYLSEAERAEGYVHLCQATPLRDTTIEIREFEGLAGVTPRKVPCRIARIERPSTDVTILHLRLPLNENMMFVAGQHIEFILPDDVRRTYSIATKPSVDGVTAIEVHIRRVPGGHFSDNMLARMKERDLMKFEGPLGSFHLRKDNNKPILMIATGTGFSPIKSMIEQALEQRLERDRPITFYWGARTRRDLYRAELPEVWTATHPNFHFVPVLSESTDDCAWTGRVGLVHEAALADIPDMSGQDVYVCGSPSMVEAARRDFIARASLPEDAFHAEAFLTRADMMANI